MACTQKTSEVVRILAQREEILEKEIHGLQQALFAMQVRVLNPVPKWS